MGSLTMSTWDDRRLRDCCISAADVYREGINNKLHPGYKRVRRAIVAITVTNCVAGKSLVHGAVRFRCKTFSEILTKEPHETGPWGWSLHWILVSLIMVYLNIAVIYATEFFSWFVINGNFTLWLIVPPLSVDNALWQKQLNFKETGASSRRVVGLTNGWIVGNDSLLCENTLRDSINTPAAQKIINGISIKLIEIWLCIYVSVNGSTCASGIRVVACWVPRHYLNERGRFINGF